MNAAREEILARVRRALHDVPRTEKPADVPVPRAYHRRAEDTQRARLERLTERLRDYHATVSVIPAAKIGAAVQAACEQHGLRRVVVPAALPAQWRPAGIDVVEDHQLSAEDLDALDGAITGCAAAIAETGTIVLDGRGACGRRAITLVPDHHICVVGEDQIVAIVPEAIARVADAVAEQRLPITLISGPSATSDIELQRVEGVHGPRTLIVLIATES